MRPVSTFSNGLVVVLLLVFSYSFFAKVLNFNQFSVDILASPLIAAHFVNPVRFLVPGIELLIILLILSPYRIWGYYLAFYVMIVFTTYFILFYQVAQSSCGCGKLFEDLGYYPHLGVNIVLIITCVYLIYDPVKPSNHDDSIINDSIMNDH